MIWSLKISFDSIEKVKYLNVLKTFGIWLVKAKLAKYTC